MTTHEWFMTEALKEAQKAYDIGEVPIGAVVVLHDKIIGRGHNLRESTHNATSHAEMIAIQEANQHLGQWRLEDCTLYVTLEPCPMCSGAIILSRIKQVVYGAKDEKAGTCGTLMNLVEDTRFNHQASVINGVLESDCQQLLKSFFKALRQRNKDYKVKTNQGKQMDKLVQQILITLSTLSNDSRIKHYDKTNMPGNYFGVMMGDLNKVAKSYAKQTKTGIALWQSDYLEARLLALKIIVPKELEQDDILWMSKCVFRTNIADEWVEKIVSKRKDCMLWEEKWFSSENLLEQRMAWGLMLRRVVEKQMSDSAVEQILKQLDNELLTYDNIIQWKANQVLVYIGVYYEKYRQQCIDIGEKLGLYVDEVVAKGCTRAYAPEWIVAKVKLLNKR